MKMPFIPEQMTQMQKAKDKESQEALQRRKRMNSIVSREEIILTRMLTDLPELKANTKLREAVASLMTPYVQAQRYRAVAAFARSH